MKKMIAMTLVTGMLLAVSVVPGHAGSREQHLVEGIIIGTGAVIIGTAIAHEIRGNGGACVVKQRRQYRHRNRHQNRDRRHGRVERVERVWVEPIYGVRWKSGHYNRRGFWVQGRHEKVIVRDGFWEKKRKRNRNRNRRPY